jgi:DNA mismatch endonuclease (patch repair protein)
MSDVMTPEQRSRTMSHIKGKDTSIEVTFRKALWHKGYRYRKNYKALPGTPDIAITKYKIAIFCDSEFFHGYNWEIKKQKLGQNRDYWINKIERNMARDRETDFKLIAMDWVPVHFWGQEIQKHIDECVEAVEDLIFELQISQFDAMIDNDRDYFKDIKY